MRVWVVRWNWIGDQAAVADPVINVLSLRTSAEHVRQYVERYYASQHYSIPEQLDQARYNKPTEPPYPAHFDTIEGMSYEGHIVCGHNPFIEAFAADEVRWNEADARLVWDENSVKVAREKFRDAVRRLSR